MSLMTSTPSASVGRLRSPGMVAAVVASAPPLRTGALRDSVRRKRDMFERGMSEPNLKVNQGKLSLERGFSCESFKWRRENEAQRLVKYRSASSVASFDSGVSLSRSASSVGSNEDLRHSSLSRSSSSDRLSRRRSSGCSLSSRCSSLTRSSTSASLTRLPLDDVTSRRSKSQYRYEPASPISDFGTVSPDLVLPDLLPSPPPLPPKKRPPLPPRRSSSSEAPPLPPKFRRPTIWDADSDEESEGTSDVSLPEFPVDGDDSLESEGDSRGAVRGNIPESFPFRDPLHKFLADLGHALSTEVVIKNVYGAGPGNLNLRAHATPTSSPVAVYSMPQCTAPARPPSLSPAASPINTTDLPLTKKYRTELQVMPHLASTTLTSTS
ncbi:hypothetical protein Hamer_G026471 [Homarus americanus]|uniref:Uncharacterized protein n=1 Tax=Homarus americanus TaxID=6706 RepID=A0A8J5K616_HOMAM|nr:hypothetical protein Hamer_G026471 [Homarus americanus]